MINIEKGCFWDTVGENLKNANFVFTVAAAELHRGTCPLTGNFILAPPASAHHQQDRLQHQHSGTVSQLGDCSTNNILTAGCDNTNKITLKNTCSKLKTGEFQELF